METLFVWGLIILSVLFLVRASACLFRGGGRSCCGGDCRREEE